MLCDPARPSKNEDQSLLDDLSLLLDVALLGDVKTVQELENLLVFVLKVGGVW